MTYSFTQNIANTMFIRGQIGVTEVDKKHYQFLRVSFPPENNRKKTASDTWDGITLWQLDPSDLRDLAKSLTEMANAIDGKKQ